MLRFYFGLREHPAKYRIAQWLGRHVVPSEGVLARVFPDVELYLHPKDWIEYILLSEGRYEPLTLEFLMQNLALGQTAVFAGVNFGLHVAVAARAVGDAGSVIGVEPQPAALLRAHANLARNDLLRPVQLLSAALGAKAGFQHMAWSDPANPGKASLLNLGPGLTVQMITLDEVIHTKLSEVPRLLLLDVEGYELQALRGLSIASAPEILVTEVVREFLAKANATVDELFSTLADLGYVLHTLHGKQVISGDLNFPEQNIVGVRKGVPIKWVTRNVG